MKLAMFILTLVSPFAYANLGPTDVEIPAQIRLTSVTISHVLCLPEGSKIKLNDGGQKQDYDVTYSECRKISSNRSYTQAAVCSQLEGDLVVDVTDSTLGTFQNKHVSEIRSLTIVQRACQ